MTTLLIIVTVFGVLLGTFLLLTKVRDKRFYKDLDEIYAAHKKLGFPELTKEVQFKIMETGDLSPIGNLIPELAEKGTPYKLLRYYIKISKNEFKEYLLNSDFLEKQKLENAPNPKHDGFWFRENQIIDQERGYVHRTWKVANDAAAIDIYADLLWEKLSFE